MPAAKITTAKRKPATSRAATKTTKSTAVKKPSAKKAVKATSRITASKAPAKRAATARKAAPARKVSKNVIIKSKLTKTQILREIAERTEQFNQKQIGVVFESLHELIQGSLKKGGCGEFAIPNVGVKIRRVSKKATKARWGRNPATGEQVWIKAKPARQVIKVTALKALKETI